MLIQKSDVFQAPRLLSKTLWEVNRLTYSFLYQKEVGKKDFMTMKWRALAKAYTSALLHECNSNTWKSTFHPLVPTGLCKSWFCAGLHLRANYILVSFDEYHPDKRYTWLPFPAAECNPAVQQYNTQRGQRSEKLRSKDPKLLLGWKIKTADYLVKVQVTPVNVTGFHLARKRQSEGIQSWPITKWNFFFFGPNVRALLMIQQPAK